MNIKFILRLFFYPISKLFCGIVGDVFVSGNAFCNTINNILTNADRIKFGHFINKLSEPLNSVFDSVDYVGNQENELFCKIPVSGNSKTVGLVNTFCNPPNKDAHVMDDLSKCCNGSFKKIAIHLDVEHFRFRNAVLNPSDKNRKIIDKISEGSYDVSHRFGCNLAKIYESIVPIRFQLKRFRFAFTAKAAHGNRNSLKPKNRKTSNRMATNG